MARSTEEPTGADGFTLVELLVVVSIIGIIAAMAAVSLQRARISANEAAAIADIRSVMSAETAYSMVNGSVYGQISCLAAPASCMAAYTGPQFLDPNMAVATSTKSGYIRTFNAGPPVAPTNMVGTGSMADFTYYAVPAAVSTGTRGFGGDGKLRLCASSDGSAPPMVNNCTGVN